MDVRIYVRSNERRYIEMRLATTQEELPVATINLESLFENESFLGLCYTDSDGVTRAFTFTLEDIKTKNHDNIKAFCIK